jgi:hypothetical protein
VTVTQSAPPGIIYDPLFPRGESRRILFYGGCHANVLAALCRRYAANRDVAFDIAINFSMISKGIPFPYGGVAEWSHIVFSPIISRESYNTVELVDACRSSGTVPVAYPWLQWNGYFPHVAKGEFAGGPGWNYPGLAVPSSAGTSRAATLFSNEAAMLENLERTTERIRSGEVDHNCDIRVADFISSHYKQDRLFLTPDHPSRHVYGCVLQQLEPALGIEIDPALYTSSVEPQHGLSIPIPPPVAETLGLKFQSADYINRTSVFKDQVFDWGEYVRLAEGFGAGHHAYESSCRTAIKCRPELTSGLTAGEYLYLPQGTLLHGVLGPLVQGHRKVDLSWALHSVQRRIRDWNEVYVYSPHWERKGGLNAGQAAMAAVTMVGAQAD